jgi:hypothetical protein
MNELGKNKSVDKIKMEIVSLIINGKINSYSEAREYMDKINLDRSTVQAILPDIFILIKRLYWGIFSVLSRENFSKLWFDLVLEDHEFRGYGNLKQYFILSKIYIAILDIHGYTKFCEEKKNNITMLQRLDEFITTKIYQCASSFGVLAAREMGDSVILISSEAASILSATFEIIALFSKERKIQFQSEILPDLFLPEFKISAGIAGGQSSNPLVITENGALSGSLINSAARLQTRASTIAPKETKVIIEQYVLYNFEKSPSKKGVLENLNFFYNGEISFKGICMKNYEVYLGHPSEHYKSRIQECLTRLRDSIKENKWQSTVFTNLCDLVSITAKSIEPFYYKIQIDRKLIYLNNQYIETEFQELKNRMVQLCDFQTAIERLGFLSRVLEYCETFDKLVLEYCATIYQTYQTPLNHYMSLLLLHIEENAARAFTPDELRVKQLYSQVKQSFDGVMKMVNQGEHLKDKRMMLWFNAIESTKKDIDFKIYSGKK